MTLCESCMARKKTTSSLSLEFASRKNASVLVTATENVVRDASKPRSVTSTSDSSRRNFVEVITRRVPVGRWTEALDHRPGDIKVIIEFAS